MISFSSSSAPYSFGTMASYSCVSGFGLSGGDATRTCGGDGSSPTGVWTGVASSCGGKSRMTLYVIIPWRACAARDTVIVQSVC